MLESLTAFRTGLPVAWMALGVVIAAQGIPTVIPVAAVMGIREGTIALFIIADPLITTFGLGQLARLATQATSGLAGRSLVSRSLLQRS
jgi:hypothetical protein